MYLIARSDVFTRSIHTKIQKYFVKVVRHHKNHFRVVAAAAVVENRNNMYKMYFGARNPIHT